MHFSTKKHFEKQPQPRFYTGKVSNSTSIKNITARQANFFLKPIKLPHSIYIYIIKFMAQNSILKTKKKKELDLIFFSGRGGDCPLLPLCGSATVQVYLLLYSKCILKFFNFFSN